MDEKRKKLLKILIFGMIIVVLINPIISFIKWIFALFPGFAAVVQIIAIIIFLAIIVYAIVLYQKNNPGPRWDDNQNNMKFPGENYAKDAHIRNDARNWARSKTHYVKRDLRIDEKERPNGKIVRPGQHKDLFGNMMRDGKEWAKKKI